MERRESRACGSSTLMKSGGVGEKLKEKEVRTTKRVHWGGAEPSITYGPKENCAKVPIRSMASFTMEEITTSLDEEDEENEKEAKNEKLVGIVQSGREGYNG